MKITFETKSAKSAVEVVFMAEGGKAPAEAKKAVAAEKFTGKKGQVSSMPGLLIVGLGAPAQLALADFESLGSTIVPALNARKAESAQVDFDISGLKKGVSAAEAAARMAEGALLNSYRFDKYMTKEPQEKKPALKTLRFRLSGAAAAKKAFAVREKVAKGVFLARDLVSEPPNVLYPESYAKIIKKELEPLGVKVTILSRAQIRKMGMGCMAAVGQGSVREEKLVTMEYNGGKKKDKPVAFVGKGITFDTGGISLKPGAGMWDMKYDMGGSAAVVGAMKALAGRKAKANVVGVVALAENMPSGDAARPSDIVTSLSGQTVEILNTDAEGRLVLCDALWYCQDKFKPTRIVDLATLTGAVLMALGNEYAACFANDDKLAEALVEAGKGTGEELWRMPLHETWDKLMNSSVADIKNISNSRNAGSATAAHFLQRFIRKGTPWAHLDIAGTAWADRPKTSVPKGATGYGVRLLDAYVAENCE